MMERRDALKVISDHRGEAAVLTTMSAIQDWVDTLSPENLDFNIGGAMGYASSIGLGVALAKPERKVVVVDGDGSLIMNLGTLVTIADVAPPNLIHVVLENGMYELTGGEPTPGNYDLAGIAKASGFKKIHTFDDVAVLRERWEAIMREEGPVFVSIQVAQGPGQPLKGLPPDHIRKFEAALRSS